MCGKSSGHLPVEDGFKEFCQGHAVLLIISPSVPSICLLSFSHISTLALSRPCFSGLVLPLVSCSSFISFLFFISLSSRLAELAFHSSSFFSHYIHFLSRFYLFFFFFLQINANIFFFFCICCSSACFIDIFSI